MSEVISRKIITLPSGSQTSVYLAGLLQSENRPMVVITADIQSAQNLMLETQYFSDKAYPCHVFPDWETLPYDQFSPHTDIISERLSCLATAPYLQNGAIFISAPTLSHRLCPATYVKAQSFKMKVGDTLSISQLRQDLQQGGYRAVSEVLEHGDYAIRGNIIDIYPMGSNQPFRIELFDDEIESLRPFDPETQRSSSPVPSFERLPAHEFPLTEAGIALFRSQWRAKFTGNAMDCSVYHDVSEGLSPSGIEYYLPLFFEKTASFFEYLPKNALVIRVSELQDTINAYWGETKHRYEQYAHDIKKPILTPADILYRTDELFQYMKCFDTYQILFNDEIYDFKSTALPPIAIKAKMHQPFEDLLTLINDHPNYRFIFTAESIGRRENLMSILRVISQPLSIQDSWNECLYSKKHFIITTAPINRGFIWTQENICIITENDLFGEQVTQSRTRKKKGQNPENIIRNLVELKIDDAVVHEDHGIGRYKGLNTIHAGGVEAEYLLLEYANHDKIYVPIAQLSKVSRYTGIDTEHAPLTKLGSKSWDVAKRKAIEEIRDTAAELLNIYARRKAKPGYQHKIPDSSYYTFVKHFPFEETQDQINAIEDVIADMTSNNPMDRLICGDVGFGKTEVAMRAAFIAVDSGKQVAVLVPTTLLAQQHENNFRDRFAEFPITIKQLSRFVSDKERHHTLVGLSDGKIDIVIGTHALLSHMNEIKNLGLVIIDEEHRFGVHQKEKMKSLRAEIDVLTMTATPIPRTLNMAMNGVRDLSIIATPPKRRLSIKTFVREYEPALCREAILREIMRGGQVFYLHNKVETIEKVSTTIQALVPQARVHTAHGQMRERELERIMSDFYHQRFNVLVCTTIIETGIDIPTANTIIIDRADMLGMAQLHQLRGRVGRSHHQAYAYLLTPPEKKMTPDAVKRLDAIGTLEDLGAGFMLATHDLEIRGAGEILGDDQSGHIQTIGYSLYTELLERAVDALQSGREPDLINPTTQDAEIDLRSPALIPSTYLPDPHTRLVFYKRMTNCLNQGSLDELNIEMIDRFGLLPEPCQHLFKVMSLKLKAKTINISKIEGTDKGITLEFSERSTINMKALIDLIQNQPSIYTLRGQKRLQYNGSLPSFDSRIAAVEQLIHRLSPEVTHARV